MQPAARHAHALPHPSTIPATMKKTDLEKNKGLKIEGRLKQSTFPDRFGPQQGALPDRRTQRRLDQERGLVPFAVKINAELVGRVRSLAQNSERDVSDVVEELLKKALADAVDDPS
jgi:hypothetical protein